MAAFTDYLENHLLNLVLRGTTFTPPMAVYLALYTSNPGEAGTGTEVSGGNYARQQLTFAAPNGKATENTNPVVFPTATVAWGNITHTAIVDAPTGGNVLFYSPLAAPRTIGVGDFFESRAGDHVVSLGGSLSTFLAHALLNHVLRNTPYTPPATIFSSLHTANPGDTGAAEVSGGTYARLATPFAAATNGVALTNAEVKFLGLPSTTVTHHAFRDAATGGNVLSAAALTAPVSPVSGDNLRFEAGQLSFALD